MMESCGKITIARSLLGPRNAVSCDGSPYGWILFVVLGASVLLMGAAIGAGKEGPLFGPPKPRTYGAVPESNQGQVETVKHHRIVRLPPIESLPPPSALGPKMPLIEKRPTNPLSDLKHPVPYHLGDLSGKTIHRLQPYENRALQTETVEGPSQVLLGSTRLPETIDPWWQRTIVDPMFPSARPHPVGLHALVYSALEHSPAVRALSRTPLIRETAIVEADAEFDATAYMETKFLDLSEPVGSELTTGGPTRFRDHDWDYTAGLRKRTRTGARVELSQQYGYQNTNSEFFVPKRQGTARLSLKFTQPILRERGRAYNTGLVVLADIDTRVAWDQFSEQLQDHLLEVTQAYWRLYFGRASLLQRQCHYARAKKLLDELTGRAEIDATTSQIALARAAVESRSADLIRAETIARDAQTRIGALVADPELIRDGQIELIPDELPRWQRIEVLPRDALLTALQNRTEVDEALQQIQAACVRLKMAKNEVLPLLNFVMETYVTGLQGNSAIGQAWADQFSVGEPSYSVGLVFEVPLGNRGALMRRKRRQMELRQMVDQFQSRMETLMAEVEIAVRKVNMSYREMASTYEALVAAESELYALDERWKLMPGDNQTASYLLDELLDSQNRLADAELTFLDAQVTYTLSFSDLNRALGTLLDCDQFSMTRVDDGGLPLLKFHATPNES